MTGIRVRFHLGKGKHFFHWQVRKETGVEYYDPDRWQLAMFDCVLRSRRGEAEKIYNGKNKSVCAWIECKRLIVQPAPAWERPYKGIAIAFNPRWRPHWTGPDGQDIDQTQHRMIRTSGRSLAVIPHHSECPHQEDWYTEGDEYMCGACGGYIGKV